MSSFYFVMRKKSGELLVCPFGFAHSVIYQNSSVSDHTGDFCRKYFSELCCGNSEFYSV